MSPSRKRFLLSCFILVISFLSVIGYFSLHVNTGTVREYRPDSNDPSQTVRLERIGTKWFLIDREQTERFSGSRRLLNPWLLSEAQLVNIAEERWGTDNAWISFQYLYVSYYDDYYRQRFDHNLTLDNQVVRTAYEQWKREQSS